MNPNYVQNWYVQSPLMATCWHSQISTRRFVHGCFELFLLFIATDSIFPLEDFTVSISTDRGSSEHHGQKPGFFGALKPRIFPIISWPGDGPCGRSSGTGSLTRKAPMNLGRNPSRFVELEFTQDLHWLVSNIYILLIYIYIHTYVYVHICRM